VNLQIAASAALFFWLRLCRAVALWFKATLGLGEDIAVMTDGSGEISVNVRIRGRVQGVWYRGWTVDEAERRGLRGWVRNRRDGSVEAVLCGPAAIIDDMIEAFWEGPPAARVESVDRSQAAPFTGRGFVTLPTE
jgi:acylphosphatase